MKAQPKFGSFEFYPARYTDYEAWVFIGGEWKQANVTEISVMGRPLSEAKYIALFGEVPALPSTAFHSGE